jgi:hypothetical protein
MSEAEVRQHLTDQHGISVGAGFTDSNAPQGLMDVRGKEVLKSVGSAAIMGQFDASALDVAVKMTADAIPHDIKTFLQELQTYA